MIIIQHIPVTTWKVLRKEVIRFPKIQLANGKYIENWFYITHNIFLGVKYINENHKC